MNFLFCFQQHKYVHNKKELAQNVHGNFFFKWVFEELARA